MTGILDFGFWILDFKIANLKSKIKNILCLASCILLSGCTAMKPGVESKLPLDTRSILATLKMRYDLVDSMRTWMNVRIESRDRKEEIREILYYQKPDKLRVDAMGTFNEPKAIALAGEKSFQIYFVAENELIRGDLTDDVVKKVFDVDLRVSDVRSAIFANPFLDGNVDGLKIEIYGDEYLIRRSSTRAGYREEISILARDEAVSKWKVLDAKGSVAQEITFSKYQEVGGILRPLRATISRPADDTHLTIESINPEINIDLGETTFSFPIPRSAKIYQLTD